MVRKSQGFVRVRRAALYSCAAPPLLTIILNLLRFQPHWGWGGDFVVENNGRSGRGPEFCAQHSHWVAHCLKLYFQGF